jgi:ureidoglycolate lyase
VTQPHIPTLDIQPLDKAVFAPFGTVIETQGAKQISINQGTTTRFDAMSAVDVEEAGGQPIISLFRGNRRPDPIEIHLLERHPLGSQAFMPLSQYDWLVVVAHGNAAGDAPDFSTLVCFKASGIQGVSYDRGTWHHPLLTLQASQDFLVIDRQGDGHNLDEVWHDGPAAIIYP